MQIYILPEAVCKHYTKMVFEYVVPTKEIEIKPALIYSRITND